MQSVYAQDDDSNEFELEEVTVTAQKREENQQKVPIQMEVISGENLAVSGQDNVDEILKNVSNALINMSPDGMRVTVRGISEDESVFHDVRASTPAVGINVDGAYNAGSSAGENLFDIERVEVLAGPQSTLYGSNSPGGIVNVVTAAPKTEKWSASASAEFGSFSTRNYNAMLNAPIYSDKIAMRLAAQRSEQGSWVDGGDNASERTTGRLKTLFQASDSLSATLTVSMSKSSSGGRRRGSVQAFDYQDGHYMDGTPVTNPWSAPVEGGPPGGAPPPAAAMVAETTAVPPGQGPPPPPGGGGGPNAVGNNAYTPTYSAEIIWDTGIGSLSIVPSYSKQKADAYDDEVEVQTDIFHEQYSEFSTEQKNLEARMTSPQDFPFTWIVGGTYYDSKRINNTWDYTDPVNDSIIDNRQENKALYANVTYPVTEQFRGTVGYRRSWDTVSNVEYPPKVGDGVSGQEYSNPDYKIGAEYDLADNSMLYASYATSYRVRAMVVDQSTPEGDRTVPPEEMKSYTVGAKNRFFNNRLQLNVNAFYYDYKNKGFSISEQGRIGRGDYQVQENGEEAYPYTDSDGVYHIYTDVNNNGVNDNTAEGLTGQDISDPWIQQYGNFRSFGGDISADWIITSKDRLNLSISYLNTKWTDAVIQFYWKWIWSDEGRDFSGMDNTMSPNWGITTSYEHQFSLWDGSTLIPHIDLQWKSDYWLSYRRDPVAAGGQAPFNYQEDYYLINGNISYTHRSGKWSLSGYVKNATNYAAKTFWHAPAGDPTLGISDPRTYGGVLSLKF
jgi:iron complex outermembrane receptor protein